MKYLLAFISVFIVMSAVSGLTIYDIQYTTNVNGSSQYEGQIVTVTGTVTRAFGNDVYIQDDTLPWHGLLIYKPSVTCRPGDNITVTGTVQEYNGKTEISSVSSTTVNSSGNAIPGPAMVSTGEVSSEKYEGMFLQFTDPVVSMVSSDREWTINDGSGPVIIYEDITYPVTYSFSIGDTLMFVRGCMDEYNGKFEIKPYGNEDVLVTLDGTGNANINPKVAAESTYIDVRLDISPSVDSTYGIIEYIKVIIPSPLSPDSIIVLNTDSTHYTVDSLADSTIMEFSQIHLTDTLKIYMKTVRHESGETYKVYTGVKSTNLMPVAEMPVIGTYPDVSIMDISEVQSTTDGFNSKYRSQLVTIKGTVTGPSSLFTPTSTSTGFWVQDSTGGVNIYSAADAMNYSFTLGMELIITGTVEEYNGITEVKYSSPDTDIVVITDTIAEVAPFVLENSRGISEMNEGELVKAEFAKVLTEPVTLGTGKNFQIQNGLSVIDVRAGDRTDAFASDALASVKPGMLVNVTGIAGQYDTSDPYNSGYQLLVRFGSDIEPVENPEDSTFTVKVLPNPVSFDNGNTARIEVGLLPEQRVTVKLFDINGRLVKTLLQNSPGSSTVVWDGTDMYGRRINIGTYILSVEAVDANGVIKRKLKPVVVATKLN